MLVWVAVLLLSGCAFTPYQAMDAASRQKVRTIGLVSVPNPPQYQVSNFSSPGLLFGALGGAVAGAAAESRSESLDRILRSAGFDYGKRMEQALTSELERAGYKVVLIALPRSSERKFVEDFSPMSAYQVDALLDTSLLGVGYFDVNFTDSALRPTVNIQTQLISWPGRQTLFSETILFGYRNPLISDTHIPAPSSYMSSDAEGVLNNRDRSIQGLDYGIASVASHIAQRLGGAHRAVDTSAYAQRSPAGGDGAGINPVRESTPMANVGTNTRVQPLQAKAAQPKFGKYSYVVEKMAKANGCQGGTGAYLTTDAGPIEGYQIECDAGVVYAARCEYGVCNQQK